MKINLIIRFLGSLLLLTFCLVLLNHLTGTLERNTLRTYSSIEEVRRVLKDIIIPSYFPEFLRWPPSKIMAGKRPYRTMILEFKDSKGKPALLLTESEKEYLNMKTLMMTEVIDELPHEIKGRKVILRVGRCSSLSCGELRWKEGDYYIRLTLLTQQETHSSPVIELLKIAESMVSSQ